MFKDIGFLSLSIKTPKALLIYCRSKIQKSITLKGKLLLKITAPVSNLLKLKFSSYLSRIFWKKVIEKPSIMGFFVIQIMFLERDLHKKFQQASYFLIIHEASYRIYIVIVFNVLIGIIKNKMNWTNLSARRRKICNPFR